MRTNEKRNNEHRTSQGSDVITNWLHKILEKNLPYRSGRASSQGSGSTMPWIDEDTLKAVNSGSWQSAPVLDDEPDTHPKAENKSKASTVVSSSANTSSGTDDQQQLPMANAPEKDSPEMAKLDELIQTLSEL